MREAMQALLDRYTSLVNCGDCGNWNPEEEPCVIAARAALARAEAAAPELIRVDVPSFVEIVEKHPTMIGIPLYYAEWPTRESMNKSP